MKKEKVILTNDNYCISEIRKDTGELILNSNIENALVMTYFKALRIAYQLKNFRIITIKEWEDYKSMKKLEEISKAFNCFGD